MILLSWYNINNFIYYKPLCIMVGQFHCIIYEVAPLYQYPLGHLVNYTMGHYTRWFIVYQMWLYEYPLIRVSAKIICRYYDIMITIL